MLCDCIPDDLGNPTQKRTWNLISNLSNDYNVHLLLVARTSFNYLQWSRISSLVTTLELLPKISLSHQTQSMYFANNTLRKHNIAAIYTQSLKLFPSTINNKNIPIIFDYCADTNLLTNILIRKQSSRIKQFDLLLTNSQTHPPLFSKFNLPFPQLTSDTFALNLIHNTLNTSPAIPFTSNTQPHASNTFQQNSSLAQTA